MSFNLTSDGSPTPRKNVPRFPLPATDLRLDTSPEVLGLGVVGTRFRQHPYHWPGNVSLTSNVQGLKRPLGSSSQANQIMQQPSAEGFKVSYQSPSCEVSSSRVLDANQHRSSRLTLAAKTNLPWLTLFSSVLMSALLPRINMARRTAPSPSRRAPRTSWAAPPTLTTTP